MTIRLALAACFCAVLLAQCAYAQDEGAKTRLAVMQAAIAALKPGSQEVTRKGALQLADKPLLRYSDPTRGLTEANTLVDAGVWRMGDGGRSTALITLELYRGEGDDHLLAYEFLSLTAGKFTVQHDTERKVAWDATGSALSLASLSGAPAPAKTPAARLVQMRQLARRFKVVETAKGEKIECRLLSQPIDRYQNPPEILDGAIFAFANSTNPEVALFLECDDEKWSYGLCRLSAAPSKIELDGGEVASFAEYLDHNRRDGVYTNNAHPVKLP